FFDVEPESYPEIAADADKIVAHALETTRPGSIILLHVMTESRAESRQALPDIIQELQAQGYNFVTISELLTLPCNTQHETRNTFPNPEATNE
ncbi:MAG: hypothetical protein GY842_01760, partial [bacterium]|nr:hypothetical protein [bacterium]